MTEWDAPLLRVIVVDDAGSTRLLLRGVLDESGLFDVVGEASSGAQAVEMTMTLQPDVVLLDLSMPDGEGADALPGIRQAAPHAAVIVLSGRNRSEAAPLLDQGARGFVQKGLRPWELIDRLREILALPIPAAGQPVVAEPAGGSLGDPTAASSHGAPTAVVCDDDPVTRRLVGQVLTVAGVTVVADTETIPNLVSVAQLAQPDIVVLDLWLEGTTGLSALPELRTVSSRSTIIVYSGRSEWRDRALAGGAAVFVEKPNFGELQVVVRRLVGDRLQSR